MTITLRRAADRGRAQLGWLDSRHTFSFADYYDPRFMGFRALRVINQDRVQGGHGFPMHPHRDFEIISYVLEGALEHEDTMGSRAVLRPGEVQVISAGTGMAHSEYNPSPDQLVHFLQIWIQPGQRGGEPRYEQKTFSEEERRNALRLVTSPDGRDGSTTIRQDASIYATLLAPQQQVHHDLAPGRAAWLHVARGEIDLDGQVLRDGDGAAVTDEPALTLTGRRNSEVLLFDLP